MTRLEREYQRACRLRDALHKLCERVGDNRCCASNATQAGAAMQELWAADEKLNDACGSLEELVRMEDKDG